MRFYPKRNGINGFYVAPYARYQNFSMEADDGKGAYSSVGGGVAVGRQWVTESVLWRALRLGKG